MDTNEISTYTKYGVKQHEYDVHKYVYNLKLEKVNVPKKLLRVSLCGFFRLLPLLLVLLVVFFSLCSCKLSAFDLLLLN